MASHFLYSTNVFLKQYINHRFANDIHYVWCSEDFDSASHGRYTVSALTAASSDPCAIYRELKRDLAGGSDRHSAKIAAQKLSLKSLAVTWKTTGKITDDQEEEMIFMVDNATPNEWRPLIYVIPKNILSLDRIELVHPSKRASLGLEYIIKDLKRDEFDIIEI